MMAVDRRESDCLKHSGHEARIKALEVQLESTDDKLDGLSSKLNLILGGVMLLWPAVQVVIWLIGRGK